MPSLFLGKIGAKKNIYEIHAFTNNFSFREFKQSEISDTDLYQKLLQERYQVLENGKPIYCTAVNPCKTDKTEQNPHDNRDGTVHIVAINGNGNIESGLSVAVDTGEKERGSLIGLPLENIWGQTEFPEGDNLNEFRERYIKSIYKKDRAVLPWEMAELYRHFKKPSVKSIVPRLGLYTGWYHLSVREARKRGVQPTWIWVFDAVKPYFNLYKLAGHAILREYAIKNKPGLISPKINKLKTVIDDKGHKIITYRGNKISRRVNVPIPTKTNGTIEFTMKGIPFLDGLVDMYKLEDDIKNGALLLPIKGREGFGLSDRIKARLGLSLSATRAFEEDFHFNNIASKLINKLSVSLYASGVWEFNEIGRINSHNHKLNSPINDI